MQQAVINGFRLSPQQGRLWLLQQDSLAYRAQCALLLEGCLRPEVLRGCLKRLPGVIPSATMEVLTRIPIPPLRGGGLPWEPR